MSRASVLTNNISLSGQSERALAKQEAELKSELDITVHRIHYLLQFYDILKEQHAKLVNTLHSAEMELVFDDEN